MIEQGLVTYLLANPGLSALIGNRLHEKVLPQNPTVPAIVWQLISDPHEQTHSGPSELAHPRFQFACWAKTTLEAVQVARALRLALNGYAGAMGAEETFGSFLLDQHDFPDPETGLTRRIADYRIWHKET
jgi:uncharacterized protein DUF3168